MLVSIICLLVGILTGVLFVIARPTARQSIVTRMTPGVSTKSVSTSLMELTPTLPAFMPTKPVPTATPMINPDYTALDLINDFGEAGLHPRYIKYRETIWAWTGGTYYMSVNETSSAVWIDDSNFTGNCNPNNLGLWVYRDSATAQEAYMEVANDATQTQLTPMTGPSMVTNVEYIHGRCLLLGAAQASIYGGVVTEYCI
jgi:hypothetical protein